MTTETTPNEDVRAVLDQLAESTDNQPELVTYSGDFMEVKVDLSRMGGEEIANFIEWHIDRGWDIHSLAMVTGIAQMSGRTYYVE
jgi:hypothetical protein